MDENPVGECPFQRCSVLRSGDDAKLGPVATSAMAYHEPGSPVWNVVSIAHEIY